jgi:hypothetical protein
MGTKLKLLLGTDRTVVVIHCLLVLVYEVCAILIGNCVEDKTSTYIFSIAHLNCLWTEVVI